MNSRLTRLKKVLREKDIGSFLITDPVNIYYISAFRSENSCLLITRAGDFIVTDFRYREDAGAIGGFRVEIVKDSPAATLKKLLGDIDVKRLGFEAQDLSYASAEILRRALKSENITLEPLSGVVEDLRLIKDDPEIKSIRESVKVAKKVYAALKKQLRPGLTERAIALKIDSLIRDFGGEKNAFETIVASGKNSSRPHAAASNKTVRVGEVVLVDYGATKGHYNCDLTRVFFLGRIQKIFYDIYDICLQAQDRAIKMIRPGISAKAVDEAARDYIASKGFGKYFGHALGHGIGLSVHESPRISSRNNQELKANMVFSVEPGIYMEGKGGIRIEDIALVTEKGCEVLTDDIPK